MRSPGKGIDPRIMIGDQSTDPVNYAKERMDIIRKTYPTLKRKFDVQGESYHAMKDAFMVLNREYANSSRTISRYVGGVYMDRSMSGQVGKNIPFRPVPKNDQKWAMTLLSKYVFAPDAFNIPEELFSYLQYERRGFSGTRDPNLNDLFLGIQKGILDQLLHKNVLKRITNSEFYGNTYNQCVISSNNYLSFNTTNAGAYSGWAIGAAVPNNFDAPMNAILCPWQDIYLSLIHI